MKDPNKVDLNNIKTPINFNVDVEPISLGKAEGKKISKRIKVDCHILRMVNESSDALVQDEELYQREGELVQVKDLGSGAVISAISRATLKERLSAIVDYTVFQGEGKESLSVKPPPDVVDALYDRKQWPGVRLLVGVREAPFLRPDGSVCQKAGYDEKTKMFLSLRVKFPHIPEHPTPEQARESFAKLSEVISDFPFATEEHKSAWFALVFTLFARSAIDGACPLFAIDANTRGSGKTRLANLAAILMTGKEAPVTIHTQDEDEFRKRAVGNFMEGTPFTLLDNVKNILGGPTLESILTTTAFKDRRLGGNATPSIPALTVWACTGNNLSFTDDCARRTLPIRLESPLENPEARADFKIPNLISFLKQNRPSLVAHILTVWRAWFVAGKPTPENLTLWGSFESWSELLLPLLCWMNLPSPMVAHESLVQNDTNKGSIYSFLCAFSEILKKNSVSDLSVREMMEEAYPTKTLSAGGYLTAHNFRAAVEDLCGIPSGKQPSAKQFAAALRRYKNRRVHDLKLTAKDGRSGITRWSVIFLSE